MSRPVCAASRQSEAATAAGWAPLTDNGWRGAVRVTDRRVESFFLDVSPGFFETLGIGQRSGRDFRAGDVPPGLDAAGRPRAGVGIVNDAFVRAYWTDRIPSAGPSRCGRTAISKSR